MNEDGQHLSMAHKAAWALLILVVAGLMGYSFWKKTHPPELDLSGRRASSQQSVHPPESLKPEDLLVRDGERELSNLAPGSDAPKPEDLAVWGRVKQFSLIDQHGKPVEAKDLLGEIWVANFVFTRCAGTCPLLTRQMAELDKELADLPNVKLISFSMDPEHDSPAVLTQYARNMGAVSPRWKFLTGDKKEIYRLTVDEFELAVRAANESKNEPIIHSQKLVLVDAQGYIRGNFSALELDSTDPHVVKLLADSVRKLKTLPPVAPGTPFVRRQR